MPSRISSAPEIWLSPTLLLFRVVLKTWLLLRPSSEGEWSPLLCSCILTIFYFCIWAGWHTNANFNHRPFFKKKGWWHSSRHEILFIKFICHPCPCPLTLGGKWIANNLGYSQTQDTDFLPDPFKTLSFYHFWGFVLFLSYMNLIPSN